MVFEVSLFSDTCGGRNCNQNVAAMFLYEVRWTTLQVIMYNFLECDSMHSAFEREKRHADVFTGLDAKTLQSFHLSP